MYRCFGKHDQDKYYEEDKEAQRKQLAADVEKFKAQQGVIHQVGPRPADEIIETYLSGDTNFSFRKKVWE